uniref:Integrase catalytic domain-containing protein n=1 Tax=Nicotiana tabacum TaxID=4097 RepID=A0A1S3YEI3_TOBAC|nr:PREDICTED: uncharacterized protein LOC107775396 [Nicotiana tabacum]
MFAWSYDDMPGLSTNIVSHRLPTNPTRPLVKQKPKKFKPDLSLRIKKELTEQIKAIVVRVTNYPSWLANIAPVHKKDGKIKIYMDYRDLNKASPKDDFPLPNIHILIDNCAKHELYSLKLNLAKYAFGVPAGKLFGFIVSRKGIELDPSKIKAIQELPSPKSKKDVMSLLGRLNYISRFIARSTVICEPIFKLLKRDVATKWTGECQKAFDRIKEYLSNPSVLVPPELGKPLLLYLLVLDNAFGYVLGQHDETGRNERAIYYLSKKFTPCEAKYTLIERTCCALTWIAHNLRHYMYAYTMHLISRIDSLKYILHKPMPTRKLAKWQILLNKFDIVYITHKAIQGQALTDHLAENPVDGDYEPLTTYFIDEEVLFSREDIVESYCRWRMFFDGAANFKRVGIREVLISESGQHYPASAKIRFHCTNNMAEYEACILGIKMHPNKNYIDPIEVEIRDQHDYCFYVDEEPDGKPWYHDIKRFLATREYPNNATNGQKQARRRLENHFFRNGEVLYRRTPNIGLLRSVDATEATRLLEEIHAEMCEPHMNGFILAKKILRAGHFWMTMESNSICYVQKCHQCQIHRDFIRVPPNELNVMGSPWSFASWRMDVIGTIKPAASNKHRFILVAIDYFTKWVKASTYKAVAKKVVADFVRNNIFCRFGIP